MGIRNFMKSYVPVDTGISESVLERAHRTGRNRSKNMYSPESLSGLAVSKNNLWKKAPVVNLACTPSFIRHPNTVSF